MILTATLLAHIIFRPPNYVGITVGNGLDEHLMFEIPEGDCSKGMKVHSGRYGDYEKAEDLLLKSHICK